MQRTVTVVSLCKTISKAKYLIIILWMYVEKGKCFDFNNFLVSTLLYTSSLGL